MAGGGGLDRGWQNVEDTAHLMKANGIFLNDLHGFQFLQPGTLFYPVHAFTGIVGQVAGIGDIAHIADLIAQVREVAEHHIEYGERPQVAQVHFAVHRGPAGIHPDKRGVEGYKFFLFAT